MFNTTIEKYTHRLDKLKQQAQSLLLLKVNPFFSEGQKKEQYNNGCEEMLKLIFETEKTLLMLRNEAFHLEPTGYIKANMHNEAPIEVEYDNQVLKIICPVLLQSTIYKSTYIKEMFMYPLSKIDIKEKIKGRASLLYIHYYDEEVRRVRDYDNFDQKRIQDALSLYFLPSDSPKYIDVFNVTRKSDNPRTEIYLADNDYILNLLKTL